MDKADKQAIIEDFRTHENDTGSTETQVAILTGRISDLSEHMRSNTHDESTRRGLLKLVGQRRRLLKYLGAKDVDRYRALVGRLGLRR